jgi:hypothetical protein
MAMQPDAHQEPALCGEGKNRELTLTISIASAEMDTGEADISAGGVGEDAGVASIARTCGVISCMYASLKNTP